MSRSPSMLKTVFPSNTLKKSFSTDWITQLNDRQWITRELNHLGNFLSDLDFNNRSSQYDSLFTCLPTFLPWTPAIGILVSLLIIFPFWLWLDDVHRRLFVQCHKFKLCDFCSVPFKQLVFQFHCEFRQKFVGFGSQFVVFPFFWSFAFNLTTSLFCHFNLFYVSGLICPWTANGFTISRLSDQPSDKLKRIDTLSLFRNRRCFYLKQNRLDVKSFLCVSVI
jgi:hypothetical protein